MGTHEVIQQLGAFQHLQRERAVRELQAIVQTGGINGDKGAIVRELFTLSESVEWERRLGFLLGAQVLMSLCEDDPQFLESVEDFARSQISHAEVRLRHAAAELLGLLAGKLGDGVWIRTRDTVVKSIEDNYDRDSGSDDRSAGEDTDAPNAADLDDRNVPGSPSLGASAHGGPAAAFSLAESLLSKAYTPAVPGTGSLRHLSEGWKALETSVRALRYIIRGVGPAFAPHATPQLRELLYRCLNHMNRFVREEAYRALEALCVAPGGTEDLVAMADELAGKLQDGLSDNWSQVRFAASRGARALMQGLPAPVPASVMRILLPAMCLNRYYIADGVRLYSQETWRLIMGDNGRTHVEAHIDTVAQYYVAQSKANNHAVREAACACMAELCRKIRADAVRPHVPGLLSALLVCFNDESWPARDAASSACGALVAAFPEESAPQMQTLKRLWFQNVADNVGSVRENAAAALAEAARGVGETLVEDVLNWVETNLLAAKEQEPSSTEFSQLNNVTQFGVAGRKPMSEDEIARHSDKAMFSCGSLAPKLRAGCMDHSYSRPSEPWELSDGAVYLVREMATVAPERVASLLPTLAELPGVRHFDHSVKLNTTVWNCLPVTAERLGKKLFKPALEGFLGEMFKDLHCDNALCECAAGRCIGAFRDWLGPRVFAGRLEDWQKREVESNENVPVSAWGQNAGAQGTGERAVRAGGLAARMRDLPPGSGIPNLLG